MDATAQSPSPPITNRRRAARYRPAALILVSAFAISLLTAVLMAHGDTQRRAAAAHTLAQSLIEQLARSGHLALVARDHEELREIARTVLEATPLIASITVRDENAQAIISLHNRVPPPGPLDQALAMLTRTLARAELPMSYFSLIPPAGEGTVLGLFGTPRADIGSAHIHLSADAWTVQLASGLERALWIGLLMFCGLTLTGFTVNWMATRPLASMRQRLRDLSGDEIAAEDIEHSIAAIDARLSRSEAEARDATETLRSREAELALARVHAEDAARMRADLVAGMSHELRAPLTAILGHTDLLTRGKLNHAQREHIATVEGAARNLLSLIDDVIQWSGLESGHTSLHEVGFRLAETMEDTLGLLAPLAFEKDLELVLFIYNDVPARVRGDPLRLQQLLTNLVSNAIKFTDQGSVVVRVMLEDEDATQVQLMVRVSDTGPGLTAAERSQLFQMYGRLGPGARVGGGGLGLAISKRLLEMMGGSIDVDSEPGRGSDFYFRLPLARASQKDSAEAPWTGLEDQRIVLVEPHETAATALTHQLMDWRMQVETLKDTDTLVQRLQSTAEARWDIALLGLRRRDVDNPALHQALRLLRRDNIPVLTLVTSIDEPVHQRLVDAGATRSLSKAPARLRLFQALSALASADDPVAGDRPLRGVQALVADDSAGSRRFVAAMLADLGAQVAQAGHGEEAVDAWRKGGFPLLLLDDRMPGMDGVETTRQIRGLARVGVSPLILGMTADSDPAAARRFVAAGADACLVKPFDGNRILRYAQHLAGNQQRARVPPEPGHGRAGGLVQDARLAALLADELPSQLAAVTTALQAVDMEAGRRDIHALHGTAAFYGLGELRVVARDIEQLLTNEEFPDAAGIARLHAATDAAVVELRTRAAG